MDEDNSGLRTLKPILIYDLSGDVFYMENEEVIVGRTPNCDICINDVRISRHHGSFIKKEGIWHVVDQGSSNGTQLNSEKLIPNEEYALTDGDQVYFAENRFNYYEDERNAPDVGDDSLTLELPKKKSTVSARKATPFKKDLIDITITEQKREKTTADVSLSSIRPSALWERAVAALIDYTVVFLFTAIHAKIFTVIGKAYLVPNLVILGYIIGAVFFLYYHVHFICSFYQTPGKMLLNLKVLPLYKDDFSSIDVIKRELLGKFISILLNLLTLIHYILKKEGRFFHDYMNETKVVKVS